MMKRMLITTAVVVALPTAMESLPVRNPRQHPVTVMMTAKMTLLKMLSKKYSGLTHSTVC